MEGHHYYLSVAIVCRLRETDILNYLERVWILYFCDCFYHNVILLSLYHSHLCF